MAINFLIFSVYWSHLDRNLIQFSADGKQKTHKRKLEANLKFFFLAWYVSLADNSFQRKWKRSYRSWNLSFSSSIAIVFYYFFFCCITIKFDEFYSYIFIHSGRFGLIKNDIKFFSARGMENANICLKGKNTQQCKPLDVGFVVQQSSP